MSQEACTRMEELLRRELTPLHLEIHDDSAAHVGHRSAQGKGHFRLRVVSTRFAGLTALQRHRLVYQVLAPLWERDLHAVSVTALTSEEFVK